MEKINQKWLSWREITKIHPLLDAKTFKYIYFLFRFINSLIVFESEVFDISHDFVFKFLNNFASINFGLFHEFSIDSFSLICHFFSSNSFKVKYLTSLCFFLKIFSNRFGSFLITIKLVLITHFLYNLTFYLRQLMISQNLISHTKFSF